MDKLRASTPIRQISEPSNRGFTLIESLVGLLLTLIIVGGLSTLYAVAMHANTINTMNLQLLNSARAKIEQIQSIPYQQVGIATPTGATGPGYFVVDPINLPEYATANGDILLSDTVTIPNGTVVTRAVTVTAVDDPADGSGSADKDGVTDSNTATILDYKRLRITSSATLKGVTYTQTIRTILQGSLDSEVNGATGVDSDGSAPPAPGGKDSKTGPGPGGKTAKVAKTPTAPTGCDIPTAPVPKGPGRHSISEQSGC